MFCKVSLTFCGPGCQAGAGAEGHESESDELTTPGPNTSSGITSKFRGGHKGERLYLSRQ